MSAINDLSVVKNLEMTHPDSVPIIVLPSPRAKTTLGKPLKLICSKFHTTSCILANIHNNLKNFSVGIYLYVIFNGKEIMVNPNILISELVKYSEPNKVLRIYYLEESMFGQN